MFGTWYWLSCKPSCEGLGAVRNVMFMSERLGDGDMVVGRMYAELTDKDMNKLAAAG